MKPSALVARVMSGLVLLFAFAMAVYRAKTQSIAHDEALMYNWFLDGGVYGVLRYNAANHVLLTLLAKPIVWAWGITELHLRLPSLLGAAVCLIAGFFLSRRLFGEGLSLFACVALLSLNPEVLDFMAIARGYILGLACLTAAMYFMARLVGRGTFDPDDKDWRWGCFLASVLLGLAVTANFTNVVPVASLALTFSLEAMGGIRPLLNFKDGRLHAFAKSFLLPGATTGFCLLWPFVIQARSPQFKVSTHQASEAVRNVFAASFLHKWTDDAFSNPGAVIPGAGSWQERVTLLGEYFFFPLLLAVVVAAVVLAWKAPRETGNRRSAQCRVIGGAAIASVILIFLLHVVVNLDYPISRYCLFLVPLFTLGGLLACWEIGVRSPRWHVREIGWLAAAIVLLDYALALQTTTFRYTSYDVISRNLYQAIATDAGARGLTEVRVGGTWWYEPEINFYRRRYSARWMLPFDIKDHSTSWETPNSLTPEDYDYFVYLPVNDPGLSGARIRTIYHDTKTQTTIIAVARK